MDPAYAVTVVHGLKPGDPDYHERFHDILPKMVGDYKVYSYNFVDENKKEAQYWRDVGTIDSYYEANMDLITPMPVFSLYNWDWPVFTSHESLPPAKISRGSGGEPSYVDGSLLCAGSIVSGGHVERSIISPGVTVHHDAHVTDSILFPGVKVGAGSRLSRCIIDKNVRIGRGVKILNRDKIENAERETDGYWIRNGIVIVMKGAVIPDHTVI